MTDTRKRILDKMKLEITDNIFDDAACSCDTILAKLNYIIANGVGGSGGDTGSYAYNKLTLNVKTYEAYSDFPVVGNIIGDIAVLSTTPIKNYYVSTSVPKSPQEGTVWIVQDNTSNYYVTSDWNKIGISYVMQYESGKWVLKKSYVYNGESWIMLYYVNLKNGYVDLTGSDINAEITKTYDYTGEYQTFKAVFSGYYKVELWGAAGRNSNNSYGASGKGAYTSGEIYLNAGEILYVYVGEQPSSATGGWNGGGTGYTGSYTGGGGGGATDIRLVPTSSKSIWNEFDSLKSRIMVAAGGGGGSYYNSGYNGCGGAGGDFVGISACNGAGQGGTGATQSMPGYRKEYPNNMLGGFGYGGTSNNTTNTNGGGGGGYYGGGAGYNIGGGGGGSSYISGYDGCSSIEEESTINNIIHNGSAYHYSGYYFINTKMIAGNKAIVPTKDGSGTMTGNSGNGHVKVTLISVQVINKKDIEKIKTDSMNLWEYTFSGTNLYSGRYQTFTSNYSGYYQVELWGAAGGNANSSYGKQGNGAYTSGQIYLNEGEKLFVYVGGTTLSLTGGWNGGGQGVEDGRTPRGGGGATDIRLMKTSTITTWNEFDSLKSRIMVAAGGGGGIYYSDSYNGCGGAGGGLVGNNSCSGASQPGTGGQQAVGGTRAYYLDQNVGGFGYGSDSNVHTNGGGGGGGGYYGGGSGYNIGGGGGGSSYISGYSGCDSISEESTINNIIHNGSAYHYSDYYFKNGNMISGSSTIPTYDGSTTMNGNSTYGHAKITFISYNEKTKDDIEQEVLELKSNWNYSYSGINQYIGRYQLFTAPEDAIYSIELWGASGRNANNSYGASGKGAYTYGEIYFSKGSKLYIYVGGTSGATATGGWNGGGTGYTGSYTGGGGGGATDIRLTLTSSLTIWNEFESLKSRIMVAAGGGGGSYYNTDYNGCGGSGGSLEGLNACNGAGQGGTGATQSMPGYRSTYQTSMVGGFGYGGTSNNTTNTNGGGGGGYYGGGAGYNIGGGGGGSSYISGYDGCSSISNNSTVDNIIHTGSAYHYSGYYFTSGNMIDGKTSTMPTQNGTGTMTGNSGNGYAKITLKTKTSRSQADLNLYIQNNLKNWNYNYSGTNGLDGRYQIFTANKSGQYKIESWGASGRNTNSSYGASGKGAYTYGEIYLTSGTTLYVYVGGTTYTIEGGWNGGGSGSNDGKVGGGGGGSTDIRISNTTGLSIWNETASLISRIMVAGGGGGGVFYSSDYKGCGGSGGGLIGNNSCSGAGQSGTGGTQISGGYRTGYPTQNLGSFGYGTTPTTHTNGAGGGGSGWYGGGAGYNIGGGGGGSSYISGHAGCIGIDSSGNPLTDTYSTLADSISYTGYKFTNTQMIDGNGYPWTTVKSSSSSGMPSPISSSTQTGQSGNGYARITYLGA